LNMEEWWGTKKKLPKKNRIREIRICIVCKRTVKNGTTLLRGDLLTAWGLLLKVPDESGLKMGAKGPDLWNG